MADDTLTFSQSPFRNPFQTTMPMPTPPPQQGNPYMQGLFNRMFGVNPATPQYRLGTPFPSYPQNLSKIGPMLQGAQPSQSAYDRQRMQALLLLHQMYQMQQPQYSPWQR